MNLTILKIGGKIVENDEQLPRVLEGFKALEGAKILVHGGAKKASDLSKQLGIQPTIVNGRRVTDADTLEVVTMVYAGWMNKKIVSLLQAMDVNAIGLTGADLNVIQSHKRIVKEIDYGFVGDIDLINTTAIQALIQQEATPVFCPIGHDKKGQLLNTNADTIAATLSTALAPFFATTLMLCFEKNGLLANPEDDDSVILSINKSEYMEYRALGIVSDGMIPKMDNAFYALDQGVKKVILCGTEAVCAHDFSGSTILSL